MASQAGLQKLTPSVREALLSGHAIPSFCQAIAELVENSFDAGATTIRVTVVPSTLSFEVEDNGTGIDRDSLQRIGRRHATSKVDFRGVDTAAATTFGFRGEALSSLACCAELDITTRSAREPFALRRVLQNGMVIEHLMELRQQNKTCWAPPRGTVVAVRNLWSGFPVRRAHALRSGTTRVMLSVRRSLERRLLASPGTSLTLYNGTDRNCVLRFDAQPSTHAAFGALFGADAARELKSTTGSQWPFRVDALLPSLTPPQATTRRCFNDPKQFVLVNGRSVSDETEECRIGAEVCAVYSHANALLRSSNDAESNAWAQTKPMFVVHISCVSSETDMTLEANKQRLEFGNWELCLGVLRQTVQTFLAESCPSLRNIFFPTAPPDCAVADADADRPGLFATNAAQPLFNNEDGSDNDPTMSCELKHWGKPKMVETVPEVECQTFSIGCGEDDRPQEQNLDAIHYCIPISEPSAYATEPALRLGEGNDFSHHEYSSTEEENLRMIPFFILSTVRKYAGISPTTLRTINIGPTLDCSRRIIKIFWTRHSSPWQFPSSATIAQNVIVCGSSREQKSIVEFGTTA